MYLCQHSQCNQSLADKIANENSDMIFAGIVSGNNIGEVWVNDLYNPTFCLVWSENLECFQFMGSYISINEFDLQCFVKNMILPFLHDKKINFFEFACDSYEWNAFICDALSNYNIKSSKQYVYKMNREKTVNINLTIPENYHIFEVNEYFIKNELKKIENREILKNQIEKSWRSFNRFLEYSTGFIAVCNNAICSFALANFLYKNIYSLDVETFEPHKRKGLSGFLSVTLINSIIKRNGDIWWDCMESNIASQKTAQKAGLIFDHEYEVFWFDL